MMDFVDELALVRAEGEGMFLRDLEFSRQAHKIEVPRIEILTLDKFSSRGLLFQINNPTSFFVRQRIALYRGDIFLPINPQGLPVLYENIDASTADANWEGSPVVKYPFMESESNN